MERNLLNEKFIKKMFYDGRIRVYAIKIAHEIPAIIWQGSSSFCAVFRPSATPNFSSGYK